MSAEALAARACAAAAAHRLGMLAQGGEELALLVDELAPFLAARPELVASVAPLLAEIVRAQERGDAIGLADGLEHELAPRLLAPRS